MVRAQTIIKRHFHRECPTDEWLRNNIYAAATVTATAHGELFSANEFILAHRFHFPVESFL